MRDCFYHNKMLHCKSQEKLQYFLARCSFNDGKNWRSQGIPSQPIVMALEGYENEGNVPYLMRWKVWEDKI